MENKINVAELLKDCPKGMELDCTIYDNIVFDYIQDWVHPIRVVTKDNEMHLNLTKYGCTSEHKNAKCVIFPKGKTTWEGFHRPFKDGDILFVESIYNWIFIYKESENKKALYKYVTVPNEPNNNYIAYNNTPLCYKKEVSKIRFATEEEKEKLFKAIKANGYKWNAETKTLQPYKENTMKEKLEQITFDIPNGYEFFGINDDNQVVLAKKQPIYPKTYEECARLLNTFCDSIEGYNCNLLSYFQELLICRDAYWKIAGDWKPNLGENFIYSIGTCYGTIEKRMVAGSSGLLLFPTEEMRDAFYENFKDLIETCKELL